MKTLQYLKQWFKPKAIDGRDINRLMQFIPENMLEDFDIELKPEYIGKHVAIEFTRENVLKQLEKDVEFGFEKALDQRGLSASAMAAVVRMWNWILEDGLQDHREYAQYGLPLFKATALLYGFPNPIGEDAGTEEKYAG